MVFASYYKKNLKEKNLLNTRYLPTDSENKIHIKVSYHLSSTQNIFIKTGYLNERLLENNDQFSGLQILLGFELRK